MISLLKGIVTVTLLAMIVLGSSSFLKLYRLTGFINPSGIHTRDEAYYIDYRTSALYLKSHYLNGDLIIAFLPDALTYYANLESDYYVQDFTFRQVLYDPSEFSPLYLEKVAGKPTFTDLNALCETISKHRRVWIVSVPDSALPLLMGAEIKRYIEKWGEVVYESYNARIYLLQN